MKILLTRSLLDEDIRYISNGLLEIVGNVFQFVTPKEFNEDEISNIAHDVDVLLGPFVTKKIIASAKKLKLIQVPWTGMDTFNFDIIRDLNVPVCNSHSNANAVAEMGIAMILDLLKKVSYHDRKMRHGNWNRDQKPMDLKAGMLAGKTVSILGYGSIGRKMGLILNCFGAKVIGIANHKHDYEEVSKMYLSSEWNIAASQADIFVCTIPLTEKTRCMINTNTISLLKKNSLLVNLSRAEIIEDVALYHSLLNGHIKGYASDVWWNTPKRGETTSVVSLQNKYEELENVVLSPHRAGFVEGALPHLDDAIVNIANLIQGKPFKNRVDVFERY